MSPDGQQTTNRMARALLWNTSVQMRAARLIGIRHLRAGRRKTLVLLRRNEGGSVAGQCLLKGAERPIIDGPTAGVVLAAIEDALEALLFARRKRRLVKVRNQGSRGVR